MTAQGKKEKKKKHVKSTLRKVTLTSRSRVQLSNSVELFINILLLLRIAKASIDLVFSCISWGIWPKQRKSENTKSTWTRIYDSTPGVCKDLHCTGVVLQFKGFHKRSFCSCASMQLHFKRPCNGVYSLKWRLTERYPRWGTLADPRPGRAAANQCKSSEFLQELRISGFPRFGVSPTCFRANKD